MAARRVMVNSHGAMSESAAYDGAARQACTKACCTASAASS